MVCPFCSLGFTRVLSYSNIVPALILWNLWNILKRSSKHCHYWLHVETQFHKTYLFGMFAGWWNHLFPTANLFGSNLWGRGVVTGKCTPRKTACWTLPLEPCWNHAGTMLRNLTGTFHWNLAGTWWSFAGTLLAPSGTLPRWNLAGTLMELCRNLVKPCWNLAETLLLEPLAGTSSCEPCVGIVFLFVLFLFA